jgi:catechol 2,3-dioxygenase-like lactoylglutathione lyase family enzyme
MTLACHKRCRPHCPYERICHRGRGPAFLISDGEFDGTFARIQRAGITYYADPYCKEPDEIYTNGTRRGTYFRDPDGHLMEILTPLL